MSFNHWRGFAVFRNPCHFRVPLRRHTENTRPMSDDDGDAGNLSPEREDGGDITTKHSGGKWTRFEDAQLLQVSRRYSAGEISTRPAFLQAMADALFGTRSPMACQSRLQMLKQGVKREPPTGERASLARAARPKRLREEEDDAMAIVPYKAARKSSMDQIEFHGHWTTAEDAVLQTLAEEWRAKKFACAAQLYSEAVKRLAGRTATAIAGRLRSHQQITDAPCSGRYASPSLIESDGVSLDTNAAAADGDDGDNKSKLPVTRVRWTDIEDDILACAYREWTEQKLGSLARCARHVMTLLRGRTEEAITS